MDISQLSQEMDRFVRSKGWYEADSRRPQTARNIAISLNLEAAELLEHFQWTEAAREGDELAAELADVALYLFQLAALTKIDLEAAILKKLSINASRRWDDS